MASKSTPITSLILASLTAYVFTALVLNGCEEGSATQTTTGQGLHGILVDTQGNPVPRALVKAWPAASGPNGLPNRPDSLPAIHAETDSEGRYSLPNLDPGIYNLYGESALGKASVLIPRVKYLETAMDLGTDTLTESGTISGMVLSEGKGLTPAFCYLQGSTFVALSDSGGAFTLGNIPAGSYRLNYVAQGYASEADSPVVVLPGQTVVLPAKSLDRDLDGQPPAPTILAAAYDSIEGIVNIAWNQSKVADWNGYYVESFPLGKDSLALLTRRFRKDTVLSDSLGRYFSPGFGSGKVEGVTMVYRIRSVDREGNVSPVPASPILIRVTRPEILEYSISLRVAEGDRDTVLCQDSLVFVLDLDQPAKGPLEVQWWMAGRLPTGSLFSIPIAQTALLASDTLVWKWRPEWTEMLGTSEPDSLRFEVSTRPMGPMARGDKRNLEVQLRPDGCFAIRRSYQALLGADKYGNQPDF